MTFQSEKFFNSENVTKSKNIVCMQKEFFLSCTIEGRDTKGQSYTFLIKWKKKRAYMTWALWSRNNSKANKHGHVSPNAWVEVVVLKKNQSSQGTTASVVVKEVPIKADRNGDVMLVRKERVVQQFSIHENCFFEKCLIVKGVEDVRNIVRVILI